MSVSVRSNEPNRVHVTEDRNVINVTEVRPLIQVVSASLPPNKILSGNIVPTTLVGANGDYYFDLATALFYGPKSDLGWGTPVLLGSVGPTGDPGVVVGPTPPVDTSLLWVDTSV